MEDGTVVDTEYDVDGNRVQVRVYQPETPSIVVDYLVDTRGLLGHVVAEIVDGSVETIYRRNDDELISLLRPGLSTGRNFHGDALGSIRTLTAADGEVTDRYEYSAFGPLVNHVGSDSQPYAFAGEPEESQTALHYNRARWLDSRAGRFVSQDPFKGSLAEPLSQHRYIYASLNPTGLKDPTGLFSAAEVNMVGAIRSIVLGIYVDLGLEFVTQPRVDPTGRMAQP